MHLHQKTRLRLHFTRPIIFAMIVIHFTATKPSDEKNMTEKLPNDALFALKIAFSYMPKAIEVTKYEYGENYRKILEHIELVREELIANDVDPEEVYGEINPENTPNSSY